MRVVRNDAFIKDRVKFTQRGSLIGMGLLLVSLVLSTRSPLISWLFLVAGFAVAMTAVRVGNRYVRLPRPDVILDKVLKGLDNRYELYHYVSPAEHLLLTPSGLIAILMREQRGQIRVRGKRWQHRPFWQRLRIILGEMPLGNPGRDLRRELARVANALPAAGIQEDSVPIEGVITFYSGKTELQVENPEFPVTLAENLRATIRTMAETHPPLPNSTRKALSAALRGERTAVEEKD